MTPRTFASVRLTGPDDDAEMHVRRHFELGMMVEVGTTSIVFVGPDYRARAAATLRRLGRRDRSSPVRRRLISSWELWVCIILAAVALLLMWQALSEPGGAVQLDWTPATYIVPVPPALQAAILGGQPVLCNSQGACVPIEAPPVARVATS